MDHESPSLHFLKGDARLQRAHFPCTLWTSEGVWFGLLSG
jgi:hypothetical protein